MYILFLRRRVCKEWQEQ